MSGTFRTVVSRQVPQGGGRDVAVRVTYEVELTSDARAVVSSRLRSIGVHHSDGYYSILTPDDARHLAVAILGALDTIDPEAVVNR